MCIGSINANSGYNVIFTGLSCLIFKLQCPLQEFVLAQLVQPVQEQVNEALGRTLLPLHHHRPLNSAHFAANSGAAEFAYRLLENGRRRVQISRLHRT
jgi:hypothetical protein